MKSVQEDFICYFCNYSICSLEEYIANSPKQKEQWRKNWYAHKKTEKHRRFSQYYQEKETSIKCLLENDDIFKVSKDKIINLLNSELLPRLNDMIMDSFINCSILQSRDSLLLFLYSFECGIYTQFNKGGSKENDNFIKFMEKMSLFKKIIDSLLKSEYQTVYQVEGSKVVDIKLINK